MLISVQPFGLNAPGGGARILRALFEESSLPVHAVCTNPEVPPPTSIAPETHLPLRPFLGRIERTRFASYPCMLDAWYAPIFRRQLFLLCQQLGATAIHAVAHGLDFGVAQEVASLLKIPFILSVHDDVIYAMKGHPARNSATEMIARAWVNADVRFVISEEMGAEYSARYGSAHYYVVTDGIEVLQPDASVAELPQVLYFMGLLHNSYYPNVQAVCDALSLLNEEDIHPWKMVLRCGVDHLPFSTPPAVVKLLPFGSEADVQDDMSKAGLLYFPLPFGDYYKNFVRFSLSTKMITYLGSGVPILYHGPEEAAAHRILHCHGAAATVTSLDPYEIANAIKYAANKANDLVASAGRLGMNQFLLKDQRRRFWDGIMKALSQAR